MNQNTPQAASRSQKRTNKFDPLKLVGTIIRHGIIALFALILAGITFVVTMDRIIMPYYQQTGLEIRLPDLTGKSLAEAGKTAHSLHLSIVQDSLVYHNIYPKDVITLQLTPPGTLVKPDRIIHVTVSKGPRPLLMPSVVGLSQREAELVVKEAGLEVKSTPIIRSNNYSRGLVAGQSPPGGQEIPEDTDVVLYISNGLPETNIKMPNLVELSLSAALDTLKFYRFDIKLVQINYVNESEMLPETVIDQQPDPGALTHTSSEVTLDVSKKE
ncbi:PASTA domain-containing protein [bacterium]|nr:PASTA domain-containing protein [bacterium]